MEGLNLIIEESYGNSDFEHKLCINNLYNILADIEEKFDVVVNNPYSSSTRIDPEQYSDLVWKKLYYSGFSEHYSFLQKLFIDTIVISKVPAISYLFGCGYSLQREVKGISQATVGSITATITAQNQAQDDNKPAVPPSSAIFVPRSLWEGKSPEAVCKAMKDNGFGDNIIAYILFTKCKKKKTHIGRLLGPRGENEHDSASRSRTNKFLAEAAASTIITD
jgi:hypothetical protein